MSAIRQSAQQRAEVIEKIIKVWNENPDVRVMHLASRFGYSKEGIRKIIRSAVASGATQRLLEERKPGAKGGPYRSRALDRT